MTVRVLLARFALALLLVFAQQQAILHELQHGVDAVAGKTAPASPLHDGCLKCLSFAGFDHAPPASVPLFGLPAPTHAFALEAALPERAGTCCSPYRSRAPPLDS